MGLKRVWKFVPEAGKKRNERVKVSSDSFSPFKALFLDSIVPASSLHSSPLFPGEVPLLGRLAHGIAPIKINTLPASRLNGALRRHGGTHWQDRS